MSAIVWWFEHSLALPFFGIGMKTDLFQSCGHCWVFQICWHIECSDPFIPHLKTVFGEGKHFFGLMFCPSLDYWLILLWFSCFCSIYFSHWHGSTNDNRGNLLHFHLSCTIKTCPLGFSVWSVFPLPLCSVYSSAELGESSDAEAETPVLCPAYVKSWLIGKNPDAGRDWGRRRRGWQRMRRLNGITDLMDMSLSELQKLAMDREA